MIDREELKSFAGTLGLAHHVVEKDYVLSWMLAGISNHLTLKPSWIFKGGTCLKKCFFETYRFSEDLDFSVRDPAHLNETFLRKAFGEVGTWIYDNSGIEVPSDSFVFKVRAEGRYVEARVGYVGPFGRGSSTPKVIFDLTGDELIALAPVDRSVYHPYSDQPNGGYSVNCYSFEEVFAEKIRALAERCRPRDLYDVVHLFRSERFGVNRTLLGETLERKCKHKDISVPTAGSIQGHQYRKELESEWESMLRHQLSALPPIAQFIGELEPFFIWLSQGKEVESPAPYAPKTGALELLWAPPARIGFRHLNTAGAGNIAQIQMAASNRVCVALTFNSKVRTVEPYSFRTTNRGNVVFYGFEREAGHIKAYTVPSIQGARATSVPFAARYLVEIGLNQPIVAPRVPR